MPVLLNPSIAIDLPSNSVGKYPAAGSPRANAASYLTFVVLTVSDLLSNAMLSLFSVLSSGIALRGEVKFNGSISRTLLRRS